MLSRIKNIICYPDDEMTWSAVETRRQDYENDALNAETVFIFALFIELSWDTPDELTWLEQYLFSGASKCRWCREMNKTINSKFPEMKWYPTNSSN